MKYCCDGLDIAIKGGAFEFQLSKTKGRYYIDTGIKFCPFCGEAQDPRFTYRDGNVYDRNTLVGPAELITARIVLE